MSTRLEADTVTEELQPLSEIDSLRNDLELARFASEVAQERLSGLVDQLRGERDVMVGLIRDLLAVVETVEGESEDESFRLQCLKAAAWRMVAICEAEALAHTRPAAAALAGTAPGATGGTL